MLLGPRLASLGTGAPSPRKGISGDPVPEVTEGSLLHALLRISSVRDHDLGQWVTGDKSPHQTCGGTGMRLEELRLDPCAAGLTQEHRDHHDHPTPTRPCVAHWQKPSEDQPNPGAQDNLSPETPRSSRIHVEAPFLLAHAHTHTHVHTCLGAGRVPEGRRRDGER